VSKENEVTYEPPVLSFFSELIRICQAVSGELEKRQSHLSSKKPVLPFTYTLTPSGKWYNGISSTATKEAVDTNCDWNADKEKELGEITKRLAEQAPAEKARSLRLQHGHLESIILKVTTLHDQLSDENYQQIIALKDTSNQKAEAARVAAEQLFMEVPLDGVGTEVWVELWEHARKYSQEIAYRGESFPFVGNDARCVLCQQPLLDSGKKCLQSFEDYVKGEMQREADEAKKSLDKALAAIGDIPTPANLKIEADAAGIGPEIYAALVGIYAFLATRKNSILGVTPTALPDIAPWLEETRRLSGLYVEDAIRFDGDAQADNRTELNTKKVALEAVKWISQQRQAIEEEIHRLITRDILQEAGKQTSTTGLSKKKGDLAESLITEAFVQRFKDELAKLNASHIKVELVKSKVEKGKVLHCLQLQGASEDSLHEILSEGEYRMISLAAFLADVTGKSHVAPFVFDDPISSLDQDFEESVVRRLVSLARERQVIVFTHRLSLLGLIQDYGEKVGIKPDVICITREPWGTGEPGDTPLFAKRPGKALNALIDGRLAQARKLYEEHGHAEYAPLAKGLCSDFRILLERMIECNLLAEVVQRYRRAVNTMGKIGKLAHITEADCRYFDEMMTKYSRYEHSQPGEAPVPLPSPDELKVDLEGLKSWHKEFTARVGE
jgi:energy-coupling factor transporter ATP-binding protein EcfA2